MAPLTLLQLNDLHGYLEPHPELFWQGGRPVTREVGGLARIKAYFDAVRAEVGEGVIALDCGDTFHGTGPVVEARATFMPALLNALNFQGMTGHWDFFYGLEHLLKLEDALTYPVLACNVYGVDGTRPFASFRLLHAGDVRVAVIGVASNLIEIFREKSGSHYRVTDGRTELKKLLPEVRAQADIVVVLSHLGYPQDCALAGELPGIDVILSGHTHNRLDRPTRIGQTLITQGGAHGSFVTRLDLEVTSQGVTLRHHELKAMSPDLPEDIVLAGQIRAILAPGREQEQIGTTAALLHRGTVLTAPADDLLTAAIRHVTGAEAAFTNGWRYGVPIPAGPVTLQAVRNLIPHNPPVSTATLSGAEIWQLLEENLEATFARDPWQQRGGYLKRSAGVTLYAKLENPAGERVQGIEVGGVPLDLQREYHLAYLTAQGIPKKFGRDHRDWPIHAVEAVERYLADTGTFTPPPEGVHLV